MNECITKLYLYPDWQVPYTTAIWNAHWLVIFLLCLRPPWECVGCKLLRRQAHHGTMGHGAKGADTVTSTPGSASV